MSAGLFGKVDASGWFGPKLSAARWFYKRWVTAAAVASSAIALSACYLEPAPAEELESFTSAPIEAPASSIAPFTTTYTGQPKVELLDSYVSPSVDDVPHEGSTASVTSDLPDEPGIDVYAQPFVAVDQATSDYITQWWTDPVEPPAPGRYWSLLGITDPPHEGLPGFAGNELPDEPGIDIYASALSAVTQQAADYITQWVTDLPDTPREGRYWSAFALNDQPPPPHEGFVGATITDLPDEAGIDVYAQPLGLLTQPVAQADVITQWWTDPVPPAPAGSYSSVYITIDQPVPATDSTVVADIEFADHDPADWEWDESFWRADVTIDDAQPFTVDLPDGDEAEESIESFFAGVTEPPVPQPDYITQWVTDLPPADRVTGYWSSFGLIAQPYVPPVTASGLQVAPFIANVGSMMRR